MATSMFPQLIMYPPPPLTSFTTAMALVTVASLASSGISGIMGKQLQYSKFWNVGTKKSTPKLPGKMGMLLAYSPAFLCSLASFAMSPNEELRFVLLKTALAIHFFKRLCEGLIIYPPTPAVTIMSVVTLAFLGNNGMTEMRGKQLQYSKFRDVGSHGSSLKVSGRTGMFMAYLPALLCGVASFFLFDQNEGLRFLLVKSALTIHFFKRTLEVLFVHKYSGPMFVDVATMISLSYFINTALMIYAQHLTQGLQEPQLDLTYLGIVIFLVGLIGNFYHHYLLSKLRDEGMKEYKIPKGGLFNLVICPHYLFEILGFIGVSCIAQTLQAFSFAVGSAILLMGRSYGTRKWYLSKFEDFPMGVKAVIPFVF